MDAVTLFVVLFALVGGGIIGFFIASQRRQDLYSHKFPDAVSLTSDTSALANLMMFLGDPIEVRSLLQRAAEWLRLQLVLPLVVIYPYDSASQELSDPVVSGSGASEMPYRFRLGIGVIGEIGANREPLLLENVSRDPRFNATMPGIEAAYLVPLVTDGTLLGVAAVQSRDVNAFASPTLQNEILQYAGMIAIQTMVARRFTDSRQAIARFERFQGLSQQLVTTLDTQELLSPIVNAAREMLDTQMSILLEVRVNEERLYPIAWSGIDDRAALGLESRLKEDLKGMVAWAKLPARTHNLRTDQRTARATQAVAAGMLSELAVPVMYADKLYGILAVETNAYRNFSDEESNLLASLAAQAGIAFRNAQLYTRLKNTNQQLETAFSDLRASQEEIARAHAAEIRAFETELETAREIQISLLPTEHPPVQKFRVAARNIPARSVSGDFYQYFLLPGSKFGVAIGDVSGKGMPAALLMAVTTTSLRDEIVVSGTATATLNAMNLRLLDRMQSTSMNSALCLAIFDTETGYAEVANAGMVQPYLSTEKGWAPLEIGGYPLGASGRSKYTGRNFILAPGSLLLMVSDGVIECQNQMGEFFGFERFEALLAQIRVLEPEAVIEHILNAVAAHAEGEDFQDDVTVVVIKAR